MVSPHLSERQKILMALIIHEHIRSTQPIGSKNLIEQYGLDMSSATVRNEMASLSEMGYLRQPYTSAGRVPTEEGYRYFVGQLMGNTELPSATRSTITHQFYQAGQDIDQWMRLAASVLANQSKAAALVTAPQTVKTRFKHLELIELRGRQILMVLVLTGGDVRQQMLTLADHVPQERLSAVAEDVTLLCQGLDYDGITALAPLPDALGQDILQLVSTTMRQENLLTGEVYRDGIINVLEEPEFAEASSARRALRVLEERPFLEDLLSQTIMNSDVGSVQVLIGGEGTWEELSDCSVVLTRYGVPDLAIGTLGVLGPVRMRYGQNDFPLSGS
ncbi:MAG: heat-inducible transcription repressor HrcA [Anaerolineae bacterium]|nr:heat-inducible transcription repressor HrcA [Anaerolineae bacterium]